MTWVKTFDLGLETIHRTDRDIILVRSVLYGKRGNIDSPVGSSIFKVNMATQTIEDKMQLQDNAYAHGIAYRRRSADDALAAIVTMREAAEINVINVDDGSFYLEGCDFYGTVSDPLNITWYNVSRNLPSTTQGYLLL